MYSQASITIRIMKTELDKIDDKDSDKMNCVSKCSVKGNVRN